MRAPLSDATSAMLLAAKFSWLVAGGSVEDVREELRKLWGAMPGGTDFQTLFVAWKNWRKDGVSFQEFERAVSVWKPNQLAETITTITCDHVFRGELLWQAREFCISDSNYSRDQHITATVHPLSGASRRKFRGNWLVPVLALLNHTGLLDIDDQPRQVFLSILAEIENADPGMA